MLLKKIKKTALEAGMNGHIAKPIDIAHLLEILSNTLKGDELSFL